MGGISETRTWNDVLTTTAAIYQNKLVDNIYDVFPLLSWSMGKLGKGLRGRSIEMIKSGGESIVVQLLKEENSTSGWYSRYDQLDTTPQDEATIGRYEWRQCSTSITIDGLSERNNTGKEQLISLLKLKFKSAEMSQRKKLSSGAWSAGGKPSGSNANQIDGVQTIFSTTETLGILPPGTQPWWKATVRTSPGSFAANGLDEMRELHNTILFGEDGPDVIFTDQNNFGRYEKAAAPLQRIANVKALDLGFLNFTYKNIPMFFDRGCPTNNMYFFNSNYINWCVHRDANNKITPFVKPANQDARTAQILFQGNFVVNNRRMFGSIEGFTP